MAADVEVKFGAQIDGLVAGINNAKDQLEGMTAPIAGIVSSFQGLGEAAATAFAVDRIVEFSEKYAELGEQIERTSLILGISTDQVQQLGFAIRMGGGDAETATLTIGILEKNIAEAASGSGTAATAFENMGIAVKNADGSTRSAVDILKDMADVLSRVSDANIRAEYGRALLGRGYQNLLPVLLEGRDGFDKLNEILDQTNSKLSNDQVRALDESAKKTKELSASWDGLMIELGADTAWTAAKQDAIDLTQSMTTTAKAIGEATHAFGEFLGLADEKVEPTAINKFNDAAARFRTAMAQQQGGGQAYGPNLPPGLQLPSLGKDQSGKDDDSAEKNDIAIEKSDLQTKLELYRLDLSAKKDADDAKVASGQISKQAELADLISLVGQERDLVLQEISDERDLYDRDSADWEELNNKKLVVAKQYANEITKLNTQIAQADAQQLKKTEESLKSAFDSLDHAMDQVLGGILAGTQTWQQAEKRLFGDLASSAIEEIGKIAVRWTAFEASKGLFGATDGITSALGAGVPTALGGTQQNSLLNAAMTKLAGVLGLNTAAHAAGTLATTGNTVATTTDTIATTTGTVATTGLTVATTTDAASSVAQLGLNTLDTGANTAAVAANTTALFASKALPSFDVGSWSIPGDMIAQVHAGEMIIPAGPAAAIRSGAGLGGSSLAGGGGAGNFTINISAIDTQSGANFLKQNAGVIASALSGQMRNFNPAMRVS